MAYVSEASHTEARGLGTWISDFAAKLRQRGEQYRAYRETYEELSAMSDRELADIGLCRLLVRDVAREAARKAG